MNDGLAIWNRYIAILKIHKALCDFDATIYTNPQSIDEYLDQLAFISEVVEVLSGVLKRLSRGAGLPARRPATTHLRKVGVLFRGPTN